MSTANKKIAADIARMAYHQKAQEDSLDELVIDIAVGYSISAVNSTDDEIQQDDEISSSEKSGSEINNGGFETQILFLLDAGPSESKIVDALGIKDNRSTVLNMSLSSEELYDLSEGMESIILDRELNKSFDPDDIAELERYKLLKKRLDDTISN